jgi:hypothetical protein
VSFNGEKTIQLVVYVPINSKKTDRNKNAKTMMMADIKDNDLIWLINSL